VTNPDLAALTRRTLNNLSTMTPVTSDWTRVMPEEEEAIHRVAAILGELNWEARRLS
jgi:hypothetical protein